MKIAIIGLGLMGGSLGLCLKENKLISTVYGLDLSKENEEEALNLGLIHELISFDKLELCDIIFIATPVDAIIELLNKLAFISSKTTIIELGSTKRKIIENTPKHLIKQTIFAHPMTGTENSGPSAALKKLYKDAVCVLCDAENLDEVHRRRGVELFSHIGMKIVFMDSLAHDHHVAIISHLPHAISFALANFVIKEEDRRNIIHLAGGSFRGMSRIAKSNPIMWSEIFKQNKENLLESIRLFEKELQKCKQMIENNEVSSLNSWMGKANSLREFL
ncbi:MULTISPECIES: prephenate dehydrogenase [unclassified Campylobacter]|uniref:prephenate dehydrogenase n=1 Tax=unclassified Campylobacter TaxID=2593542 RepID=UPI001237CDEC|nr:MULTISPECIES: prephenate dehydrogenase [unclassified Campylobacter]KAA6226265.1 prephenate dehydrogenase [Campylobacter sp. LR196d]KAA6226695.1 prephenate dehydrogenase [Campylobacter sp. LR286c]KAA6227727.1 prephenate dehydrogenase [Campylobacter sp. LR185c]KAA6231258.1 prephenate dehydrogenase [Campylobacter sp. LR291e]KAA6234148.1 prephenate dehydrogenase [Campylobacter sp. LR264d]